MDASAEELPKNEVQEMAQVTAESQPTPSSFNRRFLAMAEQSPLSARANLLRWATLTPDLGIEWRIHPSVGIVMHGTWTSWTWDNKERRYAMWQATPELRYYMGKGKQGYIGGMCKVGEFNYKLATIGKQGNLIAGGITGGYMLRLNKSFALDFSLGAGYIHVDYDKYEVIHHIRVRKGEESKKLWGITNAGVALVWKLF